MDVCELSISDSLEFFTDIRLDERDVFIAKQVLKEVKERLGFLNDVGLNYLTLLRAGGSGRFKNTWCFSARESGYG